MVEAQEKTGALRGGGGREINLPARQPQCLYTFVGIITGARLILTCFFFGIQVLFCTIFIFCGTGSGEGGSPPPPLQGLS